jgi:predicted esterase
MFSLKRLLIPVVVGSVFCFTTFAQELGKPGYFPNVPMTKRLNKDLSDYFKGEKRPKFKSMFEQSADWWMNGNKTAEKSIDYKLADQTLAIYVPDGYDGGPGWGAYVYTSPGKTGGIAGHYKDMMAKHKLIYVAPHGTQNGSGLVRRMGLTLDAYATAASLYNIDPKRVIISGLSGGGTVATSLSLMYPELFIGLVNHSSQYYLTDVPGNEHSKSFSYLNERMSEGDIKSLAKSVAERNVRMAFVTGSRDKNYKQMLGVADNWCDLGLDAKLFNQPEMGHTLANAEYLDKMLTWIEAARDEDACKQLKQLEKQRKTDELLSACRSIIAVAPEYQKQSVEAKRILKDLKDKANTQAESLIKEGKDFKSMVRLDSQWPKLACAKQLHEAINALGTKHSEAILAKEPSTKTLKKYLGVFGNYKCSESVKKAFDEAGAKTLEKLKAGKAPKTKLVAFVNYWQGMPCTKPVVEELTPVAEKELARLEKQKKPSDRSIKTFITRWQGFPVVDKAQVLLEQVAGNELSEIVKIERDSSRKSKLSYFIKRYKGTKAAERAETMYRSLSKR